MSILTSKHHVAMAESFVREVTSSSHSFYVYVGRPYPWTNEPTPDAESDSVAATELDFYVNVSHGKRIEERDVQRVTRRVDWANGTVYDRYDQDDPDLLSKNFYVLTRDDSVYKCVDNNLGASSTIEPSLRVPSGVFSTSDGYVWKYMYSLGPADMEFATDDYVPVKADPSVVSEAVPGSIDSIVVLDGGRNYRTHLTGYLAGVVNNQVITLPEDASRYDGFYVGSSVYLTSGVGGGQLRRIVAYSGSPRRVTVDRPFDVRVSLQLANVDGGQFVSSGQYVEQLVDRIGVFGQTGTVSPGDLVIQANTGAQGVVVQANTTQIRVDRDPTRPLFVLNQVIVDSASAPVQLPGSVTVTSGQVNVNGVGTNFLASLSAGRYVRLGSTNNHVRRVASVTNNTLMVVDSAWTQSLSSNTVWSIPAAMTPQSVGTERANGEVIGVDLAGVMLTYSNVAFSNARFSLGESIIQTDSSGVYQGANGIVSYANATHLIVSEVDGEFVSPLFVRGKSSGQQAQTSLVSSYPNVTLDLDTRAFATGQRIYFSDVPGSSRLTNAVVIGQTVTPGEDSHFMVGPTVTIDGDGQGAEAFAVVETGDFSSNSVISVVMANSGSGYTRATVTITANSSHGSDAEAKALVSPVRGHGADPHDELGSRWVTVRKTLDVGENELYRFPSWGSYRQVGVVKDPLWRDAWLTLGPPDRVRLSVVNPSNSFSVGEVVVQPATNASGVVVTANTSKLELRFSSGSWSANTVNDPVVGLSSNSTANATALETLDFSVRGGDQPLVQEETGARGDLVQVPANNVLRLTDVQGVFSPGYMVYDPVSNSYAMVTSVLVSNAQVDASQDFGTRFSQQARVPLTSNNNLPFVLGEVVVQDVSGARARVASANSDVDLRIGSGTGSFSVGQRISHTGTTANGVITMANSTTLRVSASMGDWRVSGNVVNEAADASAPIDGVYTVLNLTDVSKTKFQVGSDDLVGQTSGGRGQANAADSIVHPDLVRNTGEVIYYKNVPPFTRTLDTREMVSLTLRF